MRAPRLLSDHRPIRRSLAEKIQQQKELKEALKQMKSQTSPALRASIQRRIKELSNEIKEHSLKPEKNENKTKNRIYALHAD